MNIIRNKKGQFCKGTSTKGYKHTEETKSKLRKYHDVQIKQCLFCGGDILGMEKKPNAYIIRKFCSRHCANSYVIGAKKTRKEIWKKYNQKDDTKKSKRYWHELKYFNHTGLLEGAECVHCGSCDDLVVHHLDGNNGRNGNLLNNSKDNLVVLCRRCHPSFHNKWWLKGVRV